MSSVSLQLTPSVAPRSLTDDLLKPEALLDPFQTLHAKPEVLSRM